MCAFTASLVAAALFLGAGSLRVAPPPQLAQSKDKGAREGSGGVMAVPDEEGPDVVLMGRVPVYGYERGVRKAGNYSSTNSTADGDTEVATWIVMFSSNTTELQLDDMCDNFFVPCTSHGDRTQPERLGIPFLITSCSGAQLNETLARVAEKGITADYVAHDEPIRLAPMHVVSADVDVNTSIQLPEDIPFKTSIGEVVVPPIDTATVAGVSTRTAPTGWDMAAVKAQNPSAAGAGVHVYVFHAGIQFEHAEFGGRAAPAIEVLGPEVKICECRNTSCAYPSGDPSPLVVGTNHLSQLMMGTYHASQIAGSTRGVAPEARVHAVKVFGEDGVGELSWFISAASWVLTYGMKPAVVFWPDTGFAGGLEAAVTTAVDALTDAGVVFVTSAGDGWGSSCVAGSYYPGTVGSAITVAGYYEYSVYTIHLQRSAVLDSLGMNDANEVNSAFGSCVDLYAPGWRVEVDQGVYLSGTAIAAAPVAGAAAFLLSQNPTMTVAQVSGELYSAGEAKAQAAANGHVLWLHEPTMTLVPASTYLQTPNRVLDINALPGFVGLR